MGKKKKKQGNRYAMYLIMFVVCVLFTVLLVEGMRLRQEIRDNDKVRETLTAQISLENERTAEIEAMEEELKSEEFIRAAAREKFGLVDDDDIVFRKAG